VYRVQGEAVTPYYQDEAVTLYLGDCADVWPLVTGVSLILTDPPYNVSARAVGGRANTTIGKVPRKDGTMREIVRDFGDWDHDWQPEPFCQAVAGVLRPSGALVSFTSEFLFSAYLQTGLDHRALLFWRKSNPAPNFRKQIVRAMEMAVWQTKGGGWTFNAGGYCPNVWDGPVINGFTCENTNEQRWHPTQKPEWLLNQWITLFSNPGDLVADFYAGSGTTLVCAKRLGRKAVGVEAQEQYCERIAKRLQQGALDLFGNPALNDGLAV